MEMDEKTLRQLAEKIYDLDTEVYENLGSSLGRVFHGDRDRCVNQMLLAMQNRKQGYLIRSELALISNMARTIQDKAHRKEIMRKYNLILKDVMSLPTSFGEGDIIDPRIADVRAVNLMERFGKDDHLIICIGRAYGCGGSEIGFTLADELKINFYDVSIVNEVLKRMETEDGFVYEGEAFEVVKANFAKSVADFQHYHGMSKQDADFFGTSKLLVQKAKEEDFICMGRCADAILTNNNIPHISIFITAPMELRIERIMKINSSLNYTQAKRLITRQDRKHTRYYQFYTGRKWGKASNYDLCINSSSYGIRGSVDMIKRMINRVELNK